MKFKTGKAIATLASEVVKVLYVMDTAIELVEVKREQNGVLEMAAAFDQTTVANWWKVHAATSYREKLLPLTLCPPT